MSLDGLRAWIGEVERKLGVRTRVFLVLTVIAIGGAAAGIYLALDAQSNDVSKSDVEAVETRLLERIDAAGAPQVSELEAQVKALQAEVAALQAGETGGVAPEGASGATGATGAKGPAPKGGDSTSATQAGGSSEKQSTSASAKSLEKKLEEAAESEEQTKTSGDDETKKGEDK